MSYCYNNTVNKFCQDSPCAGISMIHTSSANWPPSRKREEATALENLRKRIEQSKLYKADRIVDSVVSTASSLNYEQTQQQLDNRPKLLKKVRQFMFKSFRKIVFRLIYDWMTSSISNLINTLWLNDTCSIKSTIIYISREFKFFKLFWLPRIIDIISESKDYHFETWTERHAVFNWNCNWIIYPNSKLY